MDLHNCSDCGLPHGAAGERAESDEVKIARIRKEEAVEIARLQARQDHEANATVVEVAGIEAEADVATAEAIAPAIAAAGDSAEPEPVPIVVEPGDAPAEPAAEPEPDVLPPPPADDAPAPEEHGRPKGMWAGYR